MNHHGACGQSFSDSHCGSCHQHFAGQTAFDKHRMGPRSKHAWTCVPDFLLSTILWKDPKGSWSTGTPEQFARRQEHTANMRAARAGGVVSIGGELYQIPDE